MIYYSECVSVKYKTECCYPLHQVVAEGHGETLEEMTNYFVLLFIL